MSQAIDTTLQVLDLVIAGALTATKAQQLKSQIEAMQAAGRDPSSDEWSALFADIDAQSEALDEADKRLNG